MKVEKRGSESYRIRKMYKGHSNSINRYLEKTQECLCIPRFSMHKLRHYFASKMSAIGIPEADIMKTGGWATDYVMNSFTGTP